MSKHNVLTRRDFLRLSAGTAAATFLTACARPTVEPTATPTTIPPTKAAPTATPSPTATRPEETLLKVWLAVPQERESQVWSEIARGFEDKNPGIKVDLTTKIEPGRPYFQKLQTAIAAKDVPDVTWLGAKAFVLAMGAAGLLSPLTEHIDQSRFAEGSLMHSIWESDQVKPELKGELLAVPAQLVSNLPAYNKTLFDEFDLAPPETWEEDMSNRAILKANGVIPSLFSGQGTQSAAIGFRGIIYGVSGGTVEPLWEMLMYWTRSFDDPLFYQALELFKEASQYWQEGWESATGQDLDLLWGMGKAAIYEAWTTDVVDWPSKYPGLDFGVYLHPTINGVPSAYPGGPTFHLAVPVMAKGKEEAIKFINYVASADVSIKLSKELLTLPVIKSARESEEFKALVDEYPLFARYLESDERFSQYPGGEPPLEVTRPERQKLMVMLNDLLMQYARDEVTPAQMIEQLEAAKKESQ